MKTNNNSVHYRRPVWRTALVGAAAALTPLAGFGLEGESLIGMAVGHTNNIFRSNLADTETTLDLLFTNDFEHSSNRSRSSLRSDLEFVQYTGDAADNEVLGGIDLASSYELAEDRVTWEVENNFGQTAVDPFLAASPLNRENVNFFSTGPIMNFGLGGRNGINIEGRFSDVHYEQSPLDNERIGGQVGYSRFMNSRNTLSLMVSTDSTEYADLEIASQDFDIDSAFFRFETNGDRTELSFDVGRTEITVGQDTLTGEVMREEPLVRIEFDRFGSGGSSWNVSIGQEFSDGGELFRDEQESAINLSDALDVLASASPFLNRYVRLGTRMFRTEAEYEIAVNIGEEEFVNAIAVIPDRERFGVEFAYQREFSALWMGRAEFRFDQREFTELNQDDDEFALMVEARRYVTPRVTVGLSFEHRTRSSSFTNADFEEDRILLTAQYLFLQRGLSDRERERR